VTRRYLAIVTDAVVPRGKGGTAIGSSDSAPWSGAYCAAPPSGAPTPAGNRPTTTVRYDAHRMSVARSVRRSHRSGAAGGAPPKEGEESFVG
jgi:hypothetical protein